MNVRSLLALAGALALPAAGLADTPGLGQVVPANGEDQYFNKAECSSATAQIELSWLMSTAITSGIYRIYATNTAPVTSTTGGVTQCEIADKASTPPVYAGQISPPGDIVVGPSDVQMTRKVNLALLANAATADATANCAVDNTIVYVCVHFIRYITPGVPADTVTASATGKLILSTAQPSAPLRPTLKIGDGRLYVSWTAGAAGAAVVDYLVEAKPVTGTAATRTKTSTVTSATVDGLENDTEYAVTVYARSVSGTKSDPSDAVNGIPRHVKDFWELYQDQGGPETGGCGGPAGPLAMLGLAGLAALARARRRS
ncbi:MAG: fibronectin type III domain-containing protein [Anaeromyxobacter sp.]